MQNLKYGPQCIDVERIVLIMQLMQNYRDKFECEKLYINGKSFKRPRGVT